MHYRLGDESWLSRFNSSNYANGRALLVAIIVLVLLASVCSLLNLGIQKIMEPSVHLLTDPFLQLPTQNSVNVVWLTEFEGDRNGVEYGKDLEQTAIATTTKLSRVREDSQSRVGKQTKDGKIFNAPVLRDIWRHEARITGLSSGHRVPYQVTSSLENGTVVRSDRFTLAPLPQPDLPQKILLTSDHQLMPMTAANLQKVVETVGQIDAVFLAGDLVNIADRASEWFDDNRGGAFFPALQGRAQYELEREGVKTIYRGGAIIQNAPLFTAIGNHEVMGRFSMETGLNEQFNDPFPKAAAVQRHPLQARQLSADSAALQSWLNQNTYSTETYEELFTLPESISGGKKYYAQTFGNVRLVVLFVTNIWRTPSLAPDARGRYRERDADLENPENWGYGQHIFEAITKGSTQYNWLQQELSSPEFKQAQYKIVMFHHPIHSLGDNIVPAYTNPVQSVDSDDAGKVNAIRYEYPLNQDYLIRDVSPLLEASDVDLVFYGHSHLWNRFISAGGIHFLESSNVGNTYGAYTGNTRRPIPVGFAEKYAAIGDPNGLEPVMPEFAPLIDDQGQPQPYVASNDITVFSILDAGSGVVSSYRFDTRKPDSSVIKFDEFKLSR